MGQRRQRRAGRSKLGGDGGDVDGPLGQGMLLIVRLLAHNQRIAGGHVLTQLVIDARRRGPVRKNPFVSKMTDQIRIPQVCFDPARQGCGKSSDLGRVDHSHAIAGLVEKDGQSDPVGASGLHADQDRGGGLGKGVGPLEAMRGLGGGKGFGRNINANNRRISGRFQHGTHPWYCPRCAGPEAIVRCGQPSSFLVMRGRAT